MSLPPAEVNMDVYGQILRLHNEVGESKGQIYCIASPCIIQSFEEPNKLMFKTPQQPKCLFIVA